MRIILFCISFLFADNVFSQQVIPMFSNKDSIHIQIDNDGRLYINHTFSKGNTIYSLSKTFNVSSEALLSYNNIIDPTDIDLDQNIKILINPINIITSPTLISDSIRINKSGGLVPVYYTVKPKETLFRIARIYFNLDMDKLTSNNRIINNELSIGQQLLIGYIHFGKKPIQIEIATDTTNNTSDTLLFKNVENLDSLAVKLNETLTMSYDKGPAFWKKSQKNNGQKYVLYNKAKPNSKIELYNPVTNRTVIAKVLDKIPENIYKNNINILLSPQVAKELGALDSRFFVEIKYYK